MPNYRRFYLPAAPVFVTMITQNRKPWLTQNTDLVLNSMRNVKQHYAFRHIAHVCTGQVIPDTFFREFS